MDEAQAAQAAPQGAQITYPQMTMGQFQTLAMSQLLQAGALATYRHGVLC
jgi:hypothetical protein